MFKRLINGIIASFHMKYEDISKRRENYGRLTHEQLVWMISEMSYDFDALKYDYAKLNTYAIRKNYEDATSKFAQFISKLKAKFNEKFDNTPKVRNLMKNGVLSNLRRRDY